MSVGAPAAPLLETRGLSRHFGGEAALDRLDLVGRRGEVHAITGANGAGKSTLMNLLAGVMVPSAGEIRMDGKAVRFKSPRAARDLGISVVYQELTVLPELTVAENIFLGREPRGKFGLLDRGQLNRMTAALLARLGIALEPRRPAGRLNVATQQLVEIARALSVSARVLILDEPTAVLSPAERDLLFGIVAGLRKEGLLVFFVTHRLDEVFQIADRVTVLRNGCKVLDDVTGNLDVPRLVHHMVGHDVASKAVLPEVKPDAPRIKVEFSGRDSSGSLELRSGEIVGLAGLVGAGRTRFARRLAGLERRTRTTLTAGDHRATFDRPSDALRHGVVYLTEDRKRDGLFGSRPILHNATAAILGRVSLLGLIRRRTERAAASATLERLHLVARSLRAPITELSGGNQQKVIFARALLCAPRLLICDEPTRGVDVGARDEIYAAMLRLAEEGVAILVISSELKELLMLSHRLLVIRGGAVVAELPAGASEEDVLMAGAVPA